MRKSWAVLGLTAFVSCSQIGNELNGTSVPTDAPTPTSGIVLSNPASSSSETSSTGAVSSYGPPVPVASQSPNTTVTVDPNLNDLPEPTPGPIIFGDPNRYRYAFFTTADTPIGDQPDLWPLTTVILSADPNFCSRKYAPMFLSDILLYKIEFVRDGNRIISNDMETTSPAFLAHYGNDEWPDGPSGWGDIGFHGEGCEVFSGPLARGAPAAKWSLDTGGTQVDSIAQAANLTMSMRNAGDELTYQLVASRCDAVLKYMPIIVGHHGGWVYIPCIRTILPGADPY
jgi:hypothetical protein